MTQNLYYSVISNALFKRVASEEQTRASRLTISDATPVRLKQVGDLDILSHHDTEARDEKGRSHGHRHRL
jgi:hypothetical protein